MPDSDNHQVLEILNSQATRPLLLICDHASPVIPKPYDNLGLGQEMLENHIVYDIGAGEVTRNLSQSLEAAAILAGYSRLLIDCNRQPGDPASIAEESDGIKVPGNQALGEDEKLARAEAYFWPYHHAITNAVAHLFHVSRPPALVSIHSFTPMFSGQPRKWDVGILWHRDPRLAMPLIEKLRGHGLTVGDNEPYSGLELAYTIDSHGGAAGIPNVVIEIRQDQLMDESGITQWSTTLHDVLEEILSIEGLHEVHHY